MKLFKVVMVMVLTLSASFANAAKDSKNDMPPGHIVCQSGSALKVGDRSQAAVKKIEENRTNSTEAI